jgi:hypothetical protein
MSSDAVFQRCGCVNSATGKRWDRACPRLDEPGHGSWYFTCSTPNLLGGVRRYAAAVTAPGKRRSWHGSCTWHRALRGAQATGGPWRAGCGNGWPAGLRYGPPHGFRTPDTSSGSWCRTSACAVPELYAHAVSWRSAAVAHDRRHGCSAALPDRDSDVRLVAAIDAGRVRDDRRAVGAAS